MALILRFTKGQQKDPDLIIYFCEPRLESSRPGIGFALSPSHDLFARVERQDSNRANRTDATETLVRFMSDFRYENLSRQAVEAAKVGIIDGVGVMLAEHRDVYR